MTAAATFTVFSLVAQNLDFTGTYSLTADRGTRLELLLVQDRGGGISGSLRSDAGSFELAGYIEQNVIVGTVHLDREPVDFQAYLDGAHLVVSLGGAPAGRLAYLPVGELLFTKELADSYDYGTRPRSGNDPLQGRDPLGSGNPLAPYGGNATLSFTGTFSDGHVVLELRGGGSAYSGHLSIDGRDYPIQARIQENVLVGSFSNQLQRFEFVATRDQRGLVLESEGQSYYLLHQEDFGPAPSPFQNVLPGSGIPVSPRRPLSDGSVDAMQWVDQLRDTHLVQYSGRSRSRGLDLTLCSSGRYLGNGGALLRGRGRFPETRSGDQTWRVASPVGVPYLELRSATGQIDRYSLTNDRGQILLEGYPVTRERSVVAC